MAKVILHIGLPKTATTLLQQFVFNKLNDKIDYLGVIQPREEEQNNLFLEILSLTTCSNTEYLQRLETVKSAVGNRLNMQRLPLLVSEEMFSVDSGEVTWQGKLNRLGQLFEGHELTVLVTVRDPVSAVFSYYVEIYNTIKGECSNVVNFACESNYSKIYNYPYLDYIINEAFVNAKINYIPFELLKNGRFVSEVIKSIGIESNERFELQNTNAKEKSAHWVQSHRKNMLSYFTFLFKIPIVSHLIKEPLIKGVLMYPAKLLKKIKIPMSAVKINVPSEQELHLLNSEYKEAIDFINAKVDSTVE